MDRPTLFVCLRVCHFWHRYAIDTLYEPVYISSRRQLARLADVARKFPSVRSRLAFTRTVLIAQLPCVAEFTHTFPLLLGRYLPTLGHISFLNYNHIAGPISITFYASIPLYSSVTRLSLVKFTSTYGNFLRVFCAFPQLKHLDVQEGSLLPLSPLAIRLVLPGPQGNVRLCHAPKLERLVLIQLDEGFLDKLVQWLLSTDLYITIRALEISQDLHRFDPWLRPLYEHIGPALQYLRMENVDNKYPDYTIPWAMNRTLYWLFISMKSSLLEEMTIRIEISHIIEEAEYDEHTLLPPTTGEEYPEIMDGTTKVQNSLYISCPDRALLRV